MIRAARSIFCAGLLAGSAGAETPRPRFTVAEVRYEIAADDVVGARRSGLLCTPAGKLRWNAISPDRRKVTDRVSAAAHDAGLDVKVTSDDDFDREVRTPFRIAVTVERAKVKACVPWMGLRVGKTAKLRATGELDTVWRVFDQKRRILVFKSAFCTRFKTESDSGDAVGAVLAGLASVVAGRIVAAEPMEIREELAAVDAPCEENAV